jgi:hypothetical protein
MAERKAIYKDAIVRYGVLPVLIILEKKEKRSDFEECAIIYKCLIEHEERTKVKIPTKLDSESVEHFIEGFHDLGFSGETYIKNLPHYIEEIEMTLSDGGHNYSLELTEQKFHGRKAWLAGKDLYWQQKG